MPPKTDPKVAEQRLRVTFLALEKWHRDRQLEPVMPKLYAGNKRRH